MFSRSTARRAISRMTTIAVVIVVIVIIVAGSYTAVSLSSKAATAVSTVTATSVVTSVSTASVTSTPSQTATSSSASSSVVSTIPFTLCVVNPVTNIAAIPSFIVQNESLLQKYDPNAFLSVAASESTVITEGLESGLCQVAVYSQTTLVTSVAGGVNLTEVAVQQGAELSTIIVGANTTYTSISQLKTATWCTTSFTLLNEEVVWAQEGWSSSSIKQVSSPSASASLSAVIAGACVDFDQVGGNVLQLVTGQIRSVYNVTTPWPSNVIVTTPAFAKSDPSAVQAAVDAMLQGAAVLANPAEHNYVLSLLESVFPSYTTAELNVQLLPSISNFTVSGAVSLGTLQQLINTMYEYNAISQNLTASSLVTSGFAPVGP